MPFSYPSTSSKVRDLANSYPGSDVTFSGKYSVVLRTKELVFLSPVIFSSEAEGLSPTGALLADLLVLSGVDALSALSTAAILSAAKLPCLSEGTGDAVSRAGEDRGGPSERNDLLKAMSFFEDGMEEDEDDKDGDGDGDGEGDEDGEEGDDERTGEGALS